MRQRRRGKPGECSAGVGSFAIRLSKPKGGSPGFKRENERMGRSGGPCKLQNKKWGNPRNLTKCLPERSLILSDGEAGKSRRTKSWRSKSGVRSIGRQHAAAPRPTFIPVSSFLFFLFAVVGGGERGARARHMGRRYPQRRVPRTCAAGAAKNSRPDTSGGG